MATNFQFGAGVNDGPVASDLIDQTNAVALTFASFSNALHELERATSLGPSDWSSTGSVLLGDGGTSTMYHATGGEEESFYRLITP